MNGNTSSPCIFSANRRKVIIIVNVAIKRPKSQGFVISSIMPIDAPKKFEMCVDLFWKYMKRILMK